MPIPTVFPQLQTLLNQKTWQELQTDKESIYKFPYWSLQLTGENHSAALYYTMGYDLRATFPDMEEEPEDPEMKEEAVTEKELMNELKRFYVEKFQGNVLREFYPEGGVKSETEIREGRRHGRHREYYENGKLRLRGKYTRNLRKGTWKYYTEEGKFDKKEKY
ncbi:MAG: hypothetical protein LUD15_03175 [Bacteroides sp.]|nr:hypothetical protein [Bacteroides sp.]